MGSFHNQTKTRNRCEKLKYLIKCFSQFLTSLIQKIDFKYTVKKYTIHSVARYRKKFLEM